MTNLPIENLRSFITVAEFGSFTRASEILSRSQPAISMQVKKLERILERPLFQRDEQKLTLSEEGEILFDYAVQILSLNDEVLTTLIKPELSGEIKFGIPSEFATSLLPRIVARFSKDYPTVALDVICDLSVNLLSKNIARNLDLILALKDDKKSKNSAPILIDELVWVTKDYHNVHVQRPLPLITAAKGCIYRKHAINALDKRNIPWKIVYTIPDLSGVQAAIEEGLGVTVLARSTVPENLQIIPVSNDFPKLGKIAIHLINNAGKSNIAVSRLMEYLRVSMS